MFVGLGAVGAAHVNVPLLLCLYMADACWIGMLDLNQYWVSRYLVGKLFSGSRNITYFAVWKMNT